MKFMGWSWQNYLLAPWEIVAEIIVILNEMDDS